MKAKRTLVISAFPGTGKSKYFNDWKKGLHTNKELVLDSDSSLFKWIGDPKDKVLNPEFPKNYINRIKDNIGKADIIFVSTHEEVRDALDDANLMYILVYPKNTSEIKEEYIKRYINRGNDKQFIDFISNNWNDFLIKLRQSDKCAIELNTNEYISDIIDKIVI